MAYISLNTAHATGDYILAADTNADNSAIQTAINGGLENDNIKAGAAIAQTKIASTLGGASLAADIASLAPAADYLALAGSVQIVSVAKKSSASGLIPNDADYLDKMPLVATASGKVGITSTAHAGDGGNVQVPGSVKIRLGDYFFSTTAADVPSSGYLTAGVAYAIRASISTGALVIDEHDASTTGGEVHADVIASTAAGTITLSTGGTNLIGGTIHWYDTTSTAWVSDVVATYDSGTKAVTLMSGDTPTAITNGKVYIVRDYPTGWDTRGTLAGASSPVNALLAIVLTETDKAPHVIEVSNRGGGLNDWRYRVAAGEAYAGDWVTGAWIDLSTKALIQVAHGLDKVPQKIWLDVILKDALSTYYTKAVLASGPGQNVSGNIKNIGLLADQTNVNIEVSANTVFSYFENGTTTWKDATKMYYRVRVED